MWNIELQDLQVQQKRSHLALYFVDIFGKNQTIVLADIRQVHANKSLICSKDLKELLLYCDTVTL